MGKFPGFFPTPGSQGSKAQVDAAKFLINSGDGITEPAFLAGCNWKFPYHVWYISFFFYLDLVDFYGEFFLGHIPYIPYMHALRFSL